MWLTSSFSSIRSCVHSVSNCELLALLLRLGDRDEVGAEPAPVDDLVGDAVVVEAEVPGRLVERRVEDRVLDDDVGHDSSLPGRLSRFSPHNGASLPTRLGATFRPPAGRLQSGWRLLARTEAGTYQASFRNASGVMRAF